MVCPNCGTEMSAGAEKCPSCNVAIITVAATKKRKWTATDIIEIVPLIALGGILLVVRAVLFMQHFGPAWDILSNMPAIGGLRGLVLVSESRFYSMPVVLVAFSDLMWALAGLFLLLAGIMSAVKARGMNQANAAVVLMLFGFGAQVIRFVIVYYDAIVAQGYRDKIDWVPLAIQIVLIVVVLILISLKKRAKKKLRFKQAAEKAQALRTAQELGAAMGAAEQQAARQDTPPPPQA